MTSPVCTILFTNGALRIYNTDVLLGMIISLNKFDNWVQSNEPVSQKTYEKTKISNKINVSLVILKS